MLDGSVRIATKLFRMLFWSKIKRMRYISIGVQSDTFVTTWYANTPKSWCGNPEVAIQYSSLPGVPLAEIHHFFPLFFQKCSAAGLPVRTANLSRRPKKVISTIRGVEHW